MTSNALTAEWTEQNEKIVREWARCLFNEDSIVENYLADVDAHGAKIALFSIRTNENFSDTLLVNGVQGWQEEVAEEEWDAACGRFGIVIDEHGRASIDPDGELAKRIEHAA